MPLSISHRFVRRQSFSVSSYPLSKTSVDLCDLIFNFNSIQIDQKCERRTKKSHAVAFRTKPCHRGITHQEGEISGRSRGLIPARFAPHLASWMSYPPCRQPHFQLPPRFVQLSAQLITRGSKAEPSVFLFPSLFSFFLTSALSFSFLPPFLPFFLPFLSSLSTLFHFLLSF